MCAKYGRSRMNNACTVSPYDPVGLLAKVIQSTAFFLQKKNIFCTTFESAVGLGPSAWIVAFISIEFQYFNIY